MAEAFLRHDRDRRDERAREAYLERVGGARQKTALVRRSGQVLMGVPSGWLPSGIVLDAGEIVLPDGSIADAEPLEDCFVVWQRSKGGTRQPHAAVRLELLRRRPLLHRPGETIPLSGRHAEILCTLLLAPDGLTVEELTHEIYAGGGKAVTLRAEMSRLRGALGGLITARPYRFAVPIASDLQEAEALVAAGCADDARVLARERLLPTSRAAGDRGARASRAAALRLTGAFTQLPHRRQFERTHSHLRANLLYVKQVRRQR
jgi:hypothetical protein